MDVAPGAAARVPPQLFVGAGAEPPATCKPVGNVSTKPKLVRATFAVLRMMMVKMEWLPKPEAIGFGAKLLLTLAPARLVSEADVGVPFVTPLNVLTAPAGMVFVRLPFTVMVTLRLSVHSSPASKAPPLKEKVLVPGVPVIVAPGPQSPTAEGVKSGGSAIIIPAGILSTKVISVNTADVLGLRNSIFNVDTAPPYTNCGTKPFTISMVRF